MKYYCIICNKEISRYSEKYGTRRCRICADRIHGQSILGKNNIFFKGGKPHCIDCNKLLINYTAKRCRKCANIFFGKERIKSRNFKGINNPNYIDGSACIYPSEFNDFLKESIRERDNYECQNCGMTEEEHLIVLGKVLHVHHIDYNKDNCSKENLLTLCNQCNTRANSNREYWQNFYQEKIKIILTENGGLTNGTV